VGLSLTKVLVLLNKRQCPVVSLKTVRHYPDHSLPDLRVKGMLSLPRYMTLASDSKDLLLLGFVAAV
jgi:hypothetical protein